MVVVLWRLFGIQTAEGEPWVGQREISEVGVTHDWDEIGDLFRTYLIRLCRTDIQEGQVAYHFFREFRIIQPKGFYLLWSQFLCGEYRGVSTERMPGQDELSHV